MKLLLIPLAILFPAISAGQLSEEYLHNRTLTYERVIELYTQLDKEHEEAKLLSYGSTDAGKPLHLFVIASDKNFNPATATSDKTLVLINNGIHPGEPCGVDASLKLAEDLLNSNDLDIQLKNVVVAIIPIYNVGGALNRGCCSRANQNGPEEYGFRGNARNLDLNRDFIKCDSRNARTFTEIFHLWKPDIFIDTHTSNGADYQYVITLLTTQVSKLNPTLAKYVEEEMGPKLYMKMEKRKYEMTPYVAPVNKIPDNGIQDFLDIPRFSTGYSTLFNVIGFTTETHMFKPFRDRVLSTCHFLQAVVEFANANSSQIKEIRKKANEEVAVQKDFPVSWSIDTTQYKMINFKGYEAKYKESKVTERNRIWYDREAPFEKKIKYYNRYKANVTVSKPLAYIIPQAWAAVIERLVMNQVRMERLTKDVKLQVELYHITDYNTSERPYEGHYPHSNVQLKTEQAKIQFHEGDYVIMTDQPANRYIIETLEPQAHDSYFVWNFFDPALQQKEWFSDYVFEDKAEQMLKDNPELKAKFEQIKKEDPKFAKNHWAMLTYLYRNSENYEKTHKRYPVARMVSEQVLPIK